MSNVIAFPGIDLPTEPEVEPEAEGPDEAWEEWRNDEVAHLLTLVNDLDGAPPDYFTAKAEEIVVRIQSWSRD